MKDFAPMRNCPGVQGKLIWMPVNYGYPKNRRPNTLGMSLSLKIKVLLQDLKRCKHWFSYCQKTVLNNYTKEISAKQVATQSDFLMAFLHLEL